MTKAFFASLALSGTLLSGCGRDDSNAPHFKFTDAERVWTSPYTTGAIWSFRNAQNYERTYRVGSALQETAIGKSGSRDIIYYRENLYAAIQRTDSTYQPGVSPINKYNMEFLLAAGVDPAVRQYDEEFAGYISWSNALARFPLTQLAQNASLPSGWRLLPTLQVNARDYQNVLEYTPSSWQTTAPLSFDAKRIYYARERGIIRFEERNGQVWDRI